MCALSATFDCFLCSTCWAIGSRSTNIRSPMPSRRGAACGDAKRAVDFCFPSVHNPPARMHLLRLARGSSAALGGSSCMREQGARTIVIFAGCLFLRASLGETNPWLLPSKVFAHAFTTLHHSLVAGTTVILRAGASLFPENAALGVPAAQVRDA